MSQPRTAQGLAGAAAHLCAAYEELAAAGCDSWCSEVKLLIDILDAELEWLRGQDRSVVAADP